MSRKDSKFPKSSKKVSLDSPFSSDEDIEFDLQKTLPKPKIDPVLISIFTQKGGVGKTTSTFNFACLLAKRYNMKVLLVDADPQCNLTAISLKRQVLGSYKKDLPDVKKCKSLSSSSSKESSEKKEDSEKEISYQAKRTRGEGDCPFHALLGTWDGNENEYVCPDVESKRFEVKEAILLTLEDKQNSRLKDLVFAGVQALAMRATRQNVGKQIKKISKLYDQHKKSCEQKEPEIWKTFEIELKKYPTILKYINKYGTLKQPNTLRDRFSKALNCKENELYGRIYSIPKLQEAFQEYNRKSLEEFDWDVQINAQAITEYAEFIETPGQSLLPSELDILAYVFGKTIELYPTRRVTQFQTLNEGHGLPVKIQFNGVNHYERMEALPPSPKSRDEQADNDELILSDKLDALYKEDEYFFQPIGEAEIETKKREAKRDVSEVDNFYKILALIESHKHLMKKGLPTVIKEIVTKTKLEKLEVLDETGNLYLLPSSMDIYLIDNKLTALISGTQSFEATRQFVFAPADYIRALAKKREFDIVLIDLSPNIGGLNQSLMLFSDYFMMPGVPDFFTNQAVSSIARALPRWALSYSKIDNERSLSKFVSLYIQKVKFVAGNVTDARKKRIEKIQQTFREKLLPVLKEKKMTLDDEKYEVIPMISLIQDTSLVNAENEGLPIGCIFSYPEFKILINNKDHFARYHDDFILVIQQSFGLIAKSDPRLNRFKSKFIVSSHSASEKMNTFLEDINKPHDFEQLMLSELAQESRVANDDLYPRTITSLLKFLFALRLKYPRVFFACPYAFPSGDPTDTEYLKDLNKKIVKKSPYKMAIISFYLKLNWLMMVIEFKKKNNLNSIPEVEKIYICRNEDAKDFANREEKVAHTILNQFNNPIGNEELKENPITYNLDDKNEHPVNVLKNYLKQFDPVGKRKHVDISNTKPRKSHTIRKLLLASISDSLSKREMAEIKTRELLHRQYVTDLSTEFKNRINGKTRYENSIQTLIQGIPELIQSQFPIFSKIVILSAIVSCLDQFEKQMKKAEEKEKLTTTKKKKTKKGKKAKQEDLMLNTLNKKLSNFLTLFVARKAEKSSSGDQFSPPKKRTKAIPETESTQPRYTSPLASLTILKPLGARPHTRSESTASNKTYNR